MLIMTSAYNSGVVDAGLNTSDVPKDLLPQGAWQHLCLLRGPSISVLPGFPEAIIDMKNSAAMNGLGS